MARGERREVHHEEIHDEPEYGAKGGAMQGAYATPGYAGARPYLAEYTEQGFFLKDRIRWGSVWAGLVIALTVQLLLSALGVALGIRGLVPSPGEVSETTATTLGLWMAVSAIIALFLGGLATARFAGIAGTHNGVWNGVVLWALALLLGTIAASAGVGGALDQIMRGPVGMGSAAPGEVQRALGMASAGAGWFVVGAIVALIAAAVGGAVGARHEVETVEEHTTR
jgi:hypothetical protein